MASPQAKPVPKPKSVGDPGLGYFRVSPEKAKAARAAIGHAPSLIRELAVGVTLGLVGGAVWKVYHINWKRTIQEFQDDYDNGVITTVVYDKRSKLEKFTAE